MALTDEALAAGYAALFDPLTRAAQLACLDHARLTREDGWPTIEGCLAFAKLYGIPGGDLAAFFGYLGHSERGGRTIWVDALRGPESDHVARRRATRAQARALGMAEMILDGARA